MKIIKTVNEFWSNTSYHLPNWSFNINLPSFLQSNSKLKQLLTNLSIWVIIVLIVTTISYFLFKWKKYSHNAILKSTFMFCMLFVPNFFKSLFLEKQINTGITGAPTRTRTANLLITNQWVQTYLLK